jgi:hypothetical protein
MVRGLDAGEERRCQVQEPIVRSPGGVERSHELSAENPVILDADAEPQQTIGDAQRLARLRSELTM